jgi:DNA-binding NarL/FixJ family response regulator
VWSRKPCSAGYASFFFADGYLLKDSSVDELQRALEKLGRGEKHIPDSIASQLVR